MKKKLVMKIYKICYIDNNIFIIHLELEVDYCVRHYAPTGRPTRRGRRRKEKKNRYLLLSDTHGLTRRPFKFIRVSI